MKAVQTQTKIAMIIGVDKSMIKCNTGGHRYRPKQAHERCLQRHMDKITPRILGSAWKVIKRMLREDWSPEQVSARLKIDFNLSVSTEWIYQYIYTNKLNGVTLHQHLRLKRSERNGMARTHDAARYLIKFLLVSVPPSLKHVRALVIGSLGKNHKQALVTIVERKARLSVSKKVIRKTLRCVTNAIIELLMPFKD